MITYLENNKRKFELNGELICEISPDQTYWYGMDGVIVYRDGQLWCNNETSICDFPDWEKNMCICHPLGYVKDCIGSKDKNKEYKFLLNDEKVLYDQREWECAKNIRLKNRSCGWQYLEIMVGPHDESVHLFPYPGGMLVRAWDRFFADSHEHLIYQGLFERAWAGVDGISILFGKKIYSFKSKV